MPNAREWFYSQSFHNPTYFDDQEARANMRADYREAIPQYARDRMQARKLLRDIRNSLPATIHQTLEQRAVDDLLRNACIYLNDTVSV